MPVRTETPAGGKYTIDRAGNVRGDGEVLASPSLSDFFKVYGTPVISGSVTQLSEWIVTAGVLTHFSTFTADDPAEQAEVDAWAAQIEADGEDVIRQKIADEPTADTMPLLTKREAT